MLGSKKMPGAILEVIAAQCPPATSGVLEPGMVQRDSSPAGPHGLPVPASQH